MGVLNGFIPCVMVYVAGLVAISQDTFFESILYMMFFGIGTMPLLVLFYVSSTKLKVLVHSNLVKSVMLVVVGVFLISRGILAFNSEVPKPKLGGGDIEFCEPI